MTKAKINNKKSLKFANFRAGYQEGKQRGRSFVLAKKSAASGRNFSEGYSAGKRHGQAYVQNKKSATKNGLKKTHAVSVGKAHGRLTQKVGWYGRWHQTKHHHKVHASALVVYLLLIGLVGLHTAQPALASTTWTQSDWSGGTGNSTSNQYESAFNLVSSSPGQLTLGYQSSTSDWCYTANCDGRWGKRRLVTITNNDPTVDNIPVPIQVSYQSGMKNDFSDLRFTTSNGATDLSYFVQAKSDGVSANVWVKIPSLANGNTDISMYYGNSNASSISDASGVMLFFDDFSGGSIDTNKWNVYLNSGALSVSGGRLHFNAPGSTAGIKTDNNYSTLDSTKYKLSWNYQRHAAPPDPGGSCVPSTSVTINHYGIGGPALGLEDCPDGFNGPYTWVKNINGGADSFHFLYNIDQFQHDNPYSQYELSNNTSTRLKDANYSGIEYAQNGYDAPIDFEMGGLEASIDDVMLRVTTDSGVDPSTSVSGSEDSAGEAQGSLISAVYDAGAGPIFDTLNFTTSGTGTSATVAVRTSAHSDMSGADDWIGCTGLSSGSQITSSNCYHIGQRYVQYRVIMQAPPGSDLAVEDVSISHDNDSVAPPTNASNIQMTNSGNNITNGSWTKGDDVAFSWTAGADNPGGSGVGYCLYIGSDQSADPMTTSGDWGNGGALCPYYVTDTSVNIGADSYQVGTGQKYFIVKTIDLAGNQFAGQPEVFSFQKDTTNPYPPFNFSGPSTWVNSKIFNLYWTGLDVGGIYFPTDMESGLAGVQYCITNLDLGFGGCQDSDPNWFGAAHTGTLSDVIPADNSGSGSFYTVPADASRIKDNGQSVIFVRAVDNAGNVNDASVFATVNYSTSTPSEPQNLNVTPSTSTDNNFSFSWDAPSSFVGQAGNINYCWSVNVLPAANTCNYSGAGITTLSSGAYATQPGLNTMYVVARDEAGNIDYANRASVTFTANTSAPGAPRTLSVVDASVKDSADWKLALSWASPTVPGSGVHHYKIYRSEDNASFSEVGSTTSTSFVDGNLSQVRYYYYVRACDNANNCGAASNINDALPTGHYTSPAGLVSNPRVSGISTRRATINWVTDRASDSRVQYGTSSGHYFSTEAAISNQSSDHSVELQGLSAGTTYFFKAKWTDEDGNVGVSPEYSFTTAPAPQIREVSTSDVNISSALVSFTSVGASKVKLLYGKSDGFGGLKQLNTSTAQSSYSQALAGLDDGTKYFYKLNPIDSDGNEYDGNVYSFTTPARPHITNLRFQPVDGEPTSTQKVTWTTNVAATSQLSYSAIGQPAKEAVSSVMTTEHELTIRDLVDNTEYSLVATSRDGAGNVATSDRQVFRTALDTRPPKILSVVVEASVKGSGNESHGQIVVSWKTDEPATSQVAYGVGNGGDLNSKTVEDTRLTTDHVVIVSDLSTSQVYSIQAISRDKAANTINSENHSAIIGRASDSILSIIFNALQQIFGFSSNGSGGGQ